MQAAHDKFPDKLLLSTESTVSINDFAETGGLWKDAEKYLGEIIGDLNAFSVGFIDWNLALSVAGEFFLIASISACLALLLLAEPHDTPCAIYYVQCTIELPLQFLYSGPLYLYHCYSFASLPEFLSRFAGTPLHIGPIVSYDLFGSSAMVMVDTDHQKVVPQFFYYYMGQISKFVPPGSKRISCTVTGALNTTVVSAFLTPVGGGDPAGAHLLPPGVSSKQQVVVVAMNTADTPQNYTLVDHGQTAMLQLPAHSAHTLVYDPMQRIKAV